MATEKQVRERKWIGGSDLGAIVGADPFRNAADVQQVILYGIDNRDNNVTEAGKDLEPALIRRAERILGPGRRNVERRVKGHPIKVHIDVVHRDINEPNECKTSGVLWPYAKELDEWGDAGSSEVPERVLCQTHGHMLGMCKNVQTLKGYPERCHVTALLGRRGFVMFAVPFDREFAAYLLETCDAWYERHIRNGEPMEDCQPHIETLSRLRRQPGKTLAADEVPEWVTEKWALRERQSAIETAAKNKKKQYKRDLLLAFGDAEAAWLRDNRMLTFCEEVRETIDKDRLKAVHPEIYEEFVKRTSFRKLLCKKAPKALPGPTGDDDGGETSGPGRPANSGS